MNNKESKTVLTLKQALDLKTKLVNECIELGNTFRDTASKVIFKDLTNKLANQEALHLALSKANSDLGHNERIKKRDVIQRQIEVVSKTLRDMGKENTTLGRVVKYFKTQVSKTRYNEQELENMLAKLNLSKADLDLAISSFNENNTIEVTLINS